MGEMEWTFALTGLFVLLTATGLALLVNWLMEKGEKDNEDSK